MGVNTASAGSFQLKVEARGNPRILVCPSGFKESLQPHVAADCIEAGIHRALPQARVSKAPMVDGGEGFAEALVASTQGEIHRLDVVGPVGDIVSSHFGILGDHNGKKTAVIEMAAAAGLSLVPRDRRNPLYTTTYGVGQLITAALNAEVEHILLGCGDSGTCDGGVGMAQALGARFFTRTCQQIPSATGGAALGDLTTVNLDGLDPRLSTVPIDVACNWHNVLCGPKGVARVFGPQKGASPAEVEQLDTAMNNIAQVVNSALGSDISTAPGSGASGGMGASLLLIGAKLHPRFDIITRFLNIDAMIAKCDMIVTAEGGIDYQTPRGKIPAEMARRAKTRGVPVIALAGTVGEGARVNYEAGIHAYASIMQSPMTLDNAIAEAERLLVDAAESTMRMVMIGWSLHQASAAPTVEPRAESSVPFALIRRNTVGCPALRLGGQVQTSLASTQVL